MANVNDAFSYTTDGDIAGQNGGSGWGQAWQTTAAHTTFKNRTGGQAGNAANAQLTNADHGNDRNFTADVNNGHGSFYLKNITDANSGSCNANFSATNNGLLRFAVRARRSGLDSKVYLVGATTDSTTMGTWTSDTWQLLEYEFGTDGTLSGSAPGANNVKTRFAGGPWTSVIAFANNGAVQNVGLFYEGGSGAVAGGYDTLDLVDNDASTATVGNLMMMGV